MNTNILVLIILMLTCPAHGSTPINASEEQISIGSQKAAVCWPICQQNSQLHESLKEVESQNPEKF